MIFLFWLFINNRAQTIDDLVGVTENCYWRIAKLGVGGCRNDQVFGHTNGAQECFELCDTYFSGNHSAWNDRGFESHCRFANVFYGQQCWLSDSCFAHYPIADMIIHECTRWEEWTDWSPCVDVNENGCVGLFSTRYRSCISANDKFRDSWCEEHIGGNAKEIAECTVCESATTTVAGTFEPSFGEWNDWGNCNSTCGESGYRSRTNKNYTVTQTEDCTIACDEACEANSLFPSVLVYETAVADCPSPYNGTMSAFCGADENGNAVWHEYESLCTEARESDGIPSVSPVQSPVESTSAPITGCNAYSSEIPCNEDDRCIWDQTVCKEDPFPGYIPLSPDMSDKCDLASCEANGAVGACLTQHYFDASTSADCRDACDADYFCLAFSYFIIDALSKPNCYGIRGKPLYVLEQDETSGICMVRPPLANVSVPLPSPSPSLNPTKCVDNEKCTEYAQLGQCDDPIPEMREFVRAQCPIACGFCEVEEPTIAPSTDGLCNINGIIAIANRYPSSDCSEYITRIQYGLTSLASQACEFCLRHWTESEASQFDCYALPSDTNTVYETWQQCEEPDPILCTDEEIVGLAVETPDHCGMYHLQLLEGDYSNIDREETRCRCLNATSMDYLLDNANCYPSPLDVYTLPELKDKCQYDICDQTVLGLLMTEIEKEYDTCGSLTFSRITSSDQEGTYETTEFWSLVCPCFKVFTDSQASSFNCLAIETAPMTIKDAVSYCSQFNDPTHAPTTGFPSVSQPSISPVSAPSGSPSIEPTETPPVDFVCISGRQETLTWVNGQYQRALDSNGVEYWYADHGSFIFFSDRWDMMLVSREYMNDARLFVSLSSTDLREAKLNFWDEDTEPSADPGVVFNTALCDINTFSDLCIEGLSGYNGHYLDSGYQSWSADASSLRYLLNRWVIGDNQNAPLAQCYDRPDQCAWEEWDEDLDRWIPSSGESSVEVKTSRCPLAVSTAACVIGTETYDGEYTFAGTLEDMPYFELDSYRIYSSGGSWVLGEGENSPMLTCNTALGHACYWLESGVILPDVYVLGGVCPFSRAPTKIPTVNVPTKSPSGNPAAVQNRVPTMAPSLGCAYLVVKTGTDQTVQDFEGLYAASGLSNDFPKWKKDSRYSIFYSHFQWTTGWVIDDDPDDPSTNDKGYLHKDSTDSLPPLGSQLWNYYPKNGLGESSDVPQKIVAIECLTSEDTMPPSLLPSFNSPTDIPNRSPTHIPTRNFEPTLEPASPAPSPEPTEFSRTLGIENHILSTDMTSIDDQLGWIKMVGAVLDVSVDRITFFQDKMFDDGVVKRRRLVMKLNVTCYVTYTDPVVFASTESALIAQKGIGSYNDQMQGAMEGIYVGGESTYFGLIGTYVPPNINPVVTSSTYSPESPSPQPTSSPSSAPTTSPEETTNEPGIITVTDGGSSGLTQWETIFYILLAICLALLCILFLLWLFFRQRPKHTFEKETIIYPPIEQSDSESFSDPLTPFDYSGCTAEQLRQHLTECEQTLNYIEQQLYTLRLNKKRDPSKDPEIKTLTREQRRVDLNIMTLLKMLYPEVTEEELRQMRGKFWNGEGLESDDDSFHQSDITAGVDVHIRREEMRASEDRDRQSSMGGKRKREAGYYVETEYVYRNRTPNGESEVRRQMGEYDENELNMLEQEFAETSGYEEEDMEDDARLHAWEEFLREKREKIFELEDAANRLPQVQADISSDFGDSVDQSSEVIDPGYRVVADPTTIDERYRDYVSERSVHSMNHLYPRSYHTSSKRYTHQHHIHE